MRLIEVQMVVVTTYSHVILFLMQNSSSRSCWSEILPARINPEVLQDEPEQGSHYTQWSSLVSTAGKAGAPSSTAALGAWAQVLSPGQHTMNAPHGVVQNAWRSRLNPHGELWAQVTLFFCFIF